MARESKRKICYDIYVKEIFGRHETRELIPNGANVEVTEANKIDYISKMVEFRLTDGVKAGIVKRIFCIECDPLDCLMWLNLGKLIHSNVAPPICFENAYEFLQSQKSIK